MFTRRLGHSPEVFVRLGLRLINRSFPHGRKKQLIPRLDGIHEAQLTITLAREVGQLMGTAQLDGKAKAGEMVLLVPGSGENMEDDSRMDQSDSDGMLALREILPGKYRLMAIDEGWNLEWANPLSSIHSAKTRKSSKSRLTDLEKQPSTYNAPPETLPADLPSETLARRFLCDFLTLACSRSASCVFFRLLAFENRSA